MSLKLTFLLQFAFCLISYGQFTDHVFSYDDDDYPLINTVQLADMNGDDDLDYVTLGFQSKTITIAYHNDFNEPVLDAIVSDISLRNLVLYDFDQDGDTDIIASAPFDDLAFWWKNNGVGNYERLSFPMGAYESMAFDDMNNDGVTDLVANVNDSLNVYDYTAGSVSLRKNLDYSNFNLSLSAITIFDKDNDGFPEIFCADDFEGILLYNQIAADDFTRIDLLPEVFSVEQIQVMDINGDGAYDILASSSFNGSSKLQINNGDDTFVEDKIEIQIARIQFAYLVDYDTDLDYDVIFYDGDFGDDGALFAYKNNNGSFSIVQLTADYARVEAGAIGDIDGDNDIDLVMGNNKFFDTELVVLENTGPSSTAELLDVAYAVYPTVFTDEIYLDVLEKVDYKLFNQAGQLILSGQGTGKIKIEVNEEACGIYLLQLSINEKAAIEKIIKVRPE